MFYFLGIGFIGVIDGFHVNVKSLLKQADSYTNRKLGKSIILWAVCTVGKVFTNISVGFPGRIHDARVIVNSELYKKILIMVLIFYFTTNIIC